MYFTERYSNMEQCVTYYILHNKRMTVENFESRIVSGSHHGCWIPEWNLTQISKEGEPRTKACTGQTR